MKHRAKGNSSPNNSEPVGLKDALEYILDNRLLTVPLGVSVIVFWLVIPLFIAGSAIASEVAFYKTSSANMDLFYDMQATAQNIYGMSYHPDSDMSSFDDSDFILSAGTQLELTGTLNSFCITGWNEYSEYAEKPMNWDSSLGGFVLDGEVSPDGACSYKDTVATPSAK